MTLCWDVDFCLWLFCCGRSTKLQPDKETFSTDVEIRNEMSGGGLKVSAETETVIFSKFDIRYLLQNFFFFPLKLFVSTTKPQKQKLVLHKLFAIDHLLCWDVRWNATEALRGQLEGEHNFKSLVLNFLNPRDNTII